MNLGTKVKFNIFARKISKYFDFDHLSDEQAEELDNKGYLMLDRLEILDFKAEKIGFIMGKRKMKKITTLEYRSSDTEYSYTEGLTPIETKSIDVYLIATTMNKTYKVPCEAVEIF